MPKQCFPPITNDATRLLILGSQPGEASLAQSQYYAHPQNRFWLLLGQVIGEDLPAQPYALRLQTLLRHRIGLWDVVAEARRDGSLDSALRDIRGNDLGALVQSLPDLAAIAFNGKTAARIGRKQLGELAARYELIELPSSSPAFTQALPQKLTAWQALASALRTDA